MRKVKQLLRDMGPEARKRSAERTRRAGKTAPRQQSPGAEFADPYRLPSRGEQNASQSRPPKNMKPASKVISLEEKPMLDTAAFPGQAKFSQPPRFVEEVLRRPLLQSPSSGTASLGVYPMQGFADVLAYPVFLEERRDLISLGLLQHQLSGIYSTLWSLYIQE